MQRTRQWNAILLFGMPGCGKGTQGKALGGMPGFLHIATGDIFRNLNKLGQYGREVDRYISVGKLVPDDLTVRIFRNHLHLLERQGLLDPTSTTIIMDGIPRTYVQAELLAKEIKVRKIVFLLLKDDEEAIRRIRDRALREHRTDDADVDVIRDRIKTFREQTADTLKYYPAEHIVEIDAAKSPVAILHELTGVVVNLPSS